jgi:hypothetical protein
VDEKPPLFMSVRPTTPAFPFPNYDVALNLLKDIHTFFQSIEGMTVAESCEKEGLRHIIISFKHLLESQRCFNALNNFEVLLDEKGMDDPFRADGETPNILHEIRNCAHILGMISTRYIPMDIYLTHGGLDADLSARLRHDSIEDKAKRKTFDIYAGMERNLERLHLENLIGDEEHYCKRIEAALTAEMIDVMTRKDAEINSVTGKIIYKTNGKISKIDRFNGDLGLYWGGMLPYPLSILGKYSDRTENVGTRYGVDKFTLESNQSYARKTRHIYGTEAHDDTVIKKWPQFKHAIIASDAMLGLQLTMLESANYYLGEENSNPATGNPIRFDDYLPYGLHAYHTIPEALHPISTAVNSYRKHPIEPQKINALLYQKFIPPIKSAERQFGLNSIQGIDVQSLPSSAHPSFLAT